MLLPSIDLSLTSTCEMLRCSQYTVDSAYLQACRAVKFSCPLNFNITLYRVIVSWSILRFLLLSTLRILYLKCPWDQIFNIYSFFNFCVQCGYLTYLAKFQAITSIRSLLMGLFRSRFHVRHYFALFQKLTYGPGYELQEVTSKVHHENSHG